MKHHINVRPDLFVATFIGKSNLLSAKLVAEDGKGVLTFQNGYSVVIPDVRPDEIRDRRRDALRPSGGDARLALPG